MMHPHSQFLNPEQRMKGYDFEGNVENVGFLKQMSDNRLPLSDELKQSLKKSIPLDPNDKTLIAESIP